MTSQSEEQKRRARGDGGLYWNEKRQRYVAEKTVGYDGRGKRITRKASGKSEAAALRNLAKRVKDYESGLAPTSEHYRVREAVEEWLEHGQGDADETTVNRYRGLCKNHVIPQLGGRKIRELRPAEVEQWLKGLAPSMAPSTLRLTRWCLSKAVVRAMKHGFVERNVVELADTPRAGRAGRPSKSPSMEQAEEVLAYTRDRPMHCYIVLSLLTGARTEELRALRWENVHLEATTPYIDVWYSVRTNRDTKTPKSRRTLALPKLAVQRLREHRAKQAAVRLKASTWDDDGLVFATKTGREMNQNNVIREFRRALPSVPSVDPDDWTPREMRHSFVSVLSAHGMSVEQIADLVGVAPARSRAPSNGSACIYHSPRSKHRRRTRGASMSHSG
jgi:integrase